MDLQSATLARLFTATLHGQRGKPDWRCAAQDDRLFALDTLTLATCPFPHPPSLPSIPSLPLPSVHSLGIRRPLVNSTVATSFSKRCCPLGASGEVAARNQRRNAPVLRLLRLAQRRFSISPSSLWTSLPSPSHASLVLTRSFAPFIVAYIAIMGLSSVWIAAAASLLVSTVSAATPSCGPDTPCPEYAPCCSRTDSSPSALYRVRS
jgi:hypothetical protein